MAPKIDSKTAYILNSPPEILLKIFSDVVVDVNSLLYIPLWRQAVSIPAQPPEKSEQQLWRLTHVCTDFRYFLMSGAGRSFFTGIVISEHHDSREIKARLEITVLLGLQVIIAPYRALNAHDKLCLQIIMEHAERWESLGLALTMFEMRQLEVAKGRFIRLRKLKLFILPEDERLSFHTPPLKAFEVAPALTNCSLASDDKPVTELGLRLVALPYSQLQSLHLKGHIGTPGSISFSPAVRFAGLFMVSNLHEFGPIVHEKLQYLAVARSELLVHLSLPSLKLLIIEKKSSAYDGQCHVAQFLNRSHCRNIELSLPFFSVYPFHFLGDLGMFSRLLQSTQESVTLVRLGDFDSSRKAEARNASLAPLAFAFRLKNPTQTILYHFFRRGCSKGETPSRVFFLNALHGPSHRISSVTFYLLPKESKLDDNEFECMRDALATIGGIDHNFSRDAREWDRPLPPGL